MASFFQHPQALVESEKIGARTRIWAFAHVLPGASLGADCNVCDGVFIENDVVVGDRVTIKCGVQLWDGLRVEDDVFIGPNVTFTNDPMPRSRKYPAAFPQTLVRTGASIGANATILPGLTIGQHAMVGAGAVVTRSVPPFAIVVGNPAQIVRYVDHDGGNPNAARPVTETTPASLDLQIRVRGVKLLHAPVVKDLRGTLSAREAGRDLPFVPQRCFVVFDVPSREVRGEHAHRVCEQVLVCLRGSLSVVCDDGDNRQEIELNTPEIGVYLPPMVWGVQYKYSPDAMLQVLASHPYDASDYIRSYDEFIKLLAAR
jgi:UDP-2-acetamido-3-amino-2,3-dideoxy-glucuronate N-acetyltransferase